MGDTNDWGRGPSRVACRLRSWTKATRQGSAGVRPTAIWTAAATTAAGVCQCSAASLPVVGRESTPSDKEKCSGGGDHQTFRVVLGCGTITARWSYRLQRPTCWAIVLRAESHYDIGPFCSLSASHSVALSLFAMLHRLADAGWHEAEPLSGPSWRGPEGSSVLVTRGAPKPAG